MDSNPNKSIIKNKKDNNNRYFSGNRYIRLSHKIGEK